MNELNDESLMPFGKYRGQKMLDVPATYFHYLWHDGLRLQTKTSPVAAYIQKNLSGLKDEAPDLIWS